MKHVLSILWAVCSLWSLCMGSEATAWDREAIHLYETALRAGDALPQPKAMQLERVFE